MITVMGNRIIEGVFAEIVERLREDDVTETEPWKIRRHKAVRESYEKFRAENRRSMYVFNMALATSFEIKRTTR